jgi:Pyridoxamine 5'-phosphate oxidase
MAIGAPAGKAVPPSHLDLLTAPIVGVLSTLMPDGQPHSSLVWLDTTASARG